MAKEPSQSAGSVVPVQLIERRIYILRGHKVMIDSDLAVLYRVPTFRLNEAVKRNKTRFPADFMFRLTKKESDSLTSHFAMSNGRGGRRTLPYAFTEHGEQLGAVYSIVKQLIDPPAKPKRRIGFAPVEAKEE